MRRKISTVLVAAVALLAMSVLPAHAHGHFRGGVFIGPIWGPGWWGPWPGYSYYAPPPVVVERSPEVYVQQPAPRSSEEESYWYYCRKPEGYYPYVKKCPGGWMKVVPSSPSAPEE